MEYKVLYICLHRPNRSPSQRFRFEQYINFLNQNGFIGRHVFILNEKDDKAFYAPKKFIRKFLIVLKSLLILLRETYLRKYSIIYVQREAFMLGSAYFEKQFAKRSKLIFDFDDSIWRQQTGDIKSHNKTLYFLKKPYKTSNIIQSSHMVFAGNKYLANYALQFNRNVKIIPTTIDTNIYLPKPINNSDIICIGWSGSFSTIIHFEFVVEALKEIQSKYHDKIKIKVIGDGSFYNKELEVKGLPWKKETEIKDLSEIDIGLMPLPDDEWTKGKCALKGLQYMALEIPTIMSPVGVNTEVIQDGINGYLASTTEEWVDKISALIEAPELRDKIGNAGRKTVEEKYSVNANKHLYLKYFNELVNY